MKHRLFGISIAILIVVAFLGRASTAVSQTAYSDSTAAGVWRHDPYDLSIAADVDSSDVYGSKSQSFLLAFPSYLWSAAVFPIGRLTVYAEHTKLFARYHSFFTNKAGTFGLFPQFQPGGETGTGGGARMFASDLFGKNKKLEAFYIFSGARGNTGAGAYLDPNLLGSSLFWRVEGTYLQTRNRSAAINSAIRDDPDRRFEIQQIDALSSVGWRLNSGPLAPFQRNVSLEGWFGYGRRNLRIYEGTDAPLVHAGHTTQASLIKGADDDIYLYRAGGRITLDDRDYKRPTSTLFLPINYPIPGRILTFADGLYHSYRDLGYPERGGLLSAEAEIVTASDDFEYYRVAAQASRYFTLFWPNRVLALNAQIEKIRGIDGNDVPYTELATMGGSTSARGYRRGYFRGQGSLVLNAEYRYPIWDTWNAFVFWDESQIFDHFDDIDSDGFRSSFGGGIAFRTPIGLLGKLQVSHSAEESALIGFALDQSF